MDVTFDDGLNREKIKLSYNIQDNNVFLRLCDLKRVIECERQKNISIDELITFLKSAINYGDMQIWLMQKQMDGIELTLNEKLKKLFEIKSNEDILRLYDIEQNYDQNNIDGISKNLKKVQTKSIPKK